MAALQIWDAAVSSQNLAENRAFALRAIETLRHTMREEPGTIDLIDSALANLEAGEPNDFLTYVDIAERVELDEGRRESVGALSVLRAYGTLLTRLWNGPQIEGEAAVVRARRLASEEDGSKPQC